MIPATVPPPVRPPRFSRWLLELTLPSGEHGQIIRGDLCEEFAARAGAGSARSARAWYRRQALSVAGRYFFNRQKASLLDTLRQDVRYAIRTLLKSRGFTAAVLATLTIGIGAATAIFSIVNAVLIRPLPYPDADRLMFLKEVPTDGDSLSVSWPTFADWRDRLTSLEALAGSRPATYAIVDPQHPQRVNGRHVTWNFFRVLGVPPAEGRDFTPDDDRPGAEGVIIVSDRFRTRQFGAETAVLGRTIRLGSNARTIVGVAPAGFKYFRDEDVFEPLGLYRTAGAPLLDRGNHTGLFGVGRLNPGVSEETARQELVALAAAVAQAHPDSNSGASAHLQPLSRRVVGDMRPVLLALFGAVGFLLLLGCVNVANLLVARGATREHELAVRAALGCGRLRLMRQLLVESTLLSLAGGVGGLAAGYGLLRLLIALAPATLPRLDEVQLDGAAVVFALAASLACGLLFGILPALHASSARSQQLLVRSSRAGMAVAAHRLRRGLMVIEVALALMLLTGAGLTMRTMSELAAVDPGYDPKGLLTARFTAAGQGWDDPKFAAFSGDLLTALRALPGVKNAALTLSLPIEGSIWGSVFIVGDKPVPPRLDLPNAAFTTVTEGYFETLGLRLVAGRFFRTSDGPRSARVAIVNETAARRLWPGEDPIGKRIKQGWPESTTPWSEVVGVAGDIKLEGVDVETPMQVYLPVPQWPGGALAMVVRASGDPNAAIKPVQEAVRRIAPSVPVYDVQSLDELMDGALARRRASMAIFLVFAIIAVTLASIGLYGVVAHSVTQRTHEIGVRMALGAGAADVVRLFLRQGIVTTIVGLIIGTTGAIALSRFIEDLLFGVTPTDAATLSSVIGTLFLVALAACYLPARRATRVDPTVALRQ